MFVANTYLKILPDTKWYQWGIAFWLLILILHFVKVFVTDQFMGKEWEREEINKLVIDSVYLIGLVARPFIHPQGV